MDFKDIIQMALDEYMGDLLNSVDGLTDEERRFQPTEESFHINFAVWHMARTEDGWVQYFSHRTDDLWQRDSWFEKIGLPERDEGYGYSAEQVANMPKFDLRGVLDYYEAVRRETNKCLDSIDAATLDHVPHPERLPGYTVGKMFSHIIVEEAQHVGQIAYLRGTQRGLNK